jgi:hypothetical protein
VPVAADPVEAEGVERPEGGVRQPPHGRRFPRQRAGPPGVIEGRFQGSETSHA